MCGFLRRLMDAEVVDDARLNGVLAAPVAKDVPGEVDKILNLRAKIAAASESSSSDSGSDWD